MGGSSRLPYVRNWLAGYFNIEVDQLKNTVSEDEGVAIGATIMAAILTGQKKDKVILNDVIPSTIGIQTLFNKMEPLI